MLTGRRFLRVLALTAVILWLPPPGAPGVPATAQEADGSRVGGVEASRAATLRSYEAPPSPRLRLAPLPTSGPAAPAVGDGPMQVGTVRWLPAPQRRRRRPPQPVRRRLLRLLQPGRPLHRRLRLCRLRL